MALRSVAWLSTYYVPRGSIARQFRGEGLERPGAAAWGPRGVGVAWQCSVAWHAVAYYEVASYNAA